MSNYDQDPNIVKQVQTAVNAQGYQPPLAVDGVYGPHTQAGVAWFQGQHGLVQDGIIGDATLAATISIPTPSGPPLVPPVTTLPTSSHQNLSNVVHINPDGTKTISLHLAGVPKPPPPPKPKVISIHLAGVSKMPPLVPGVPVPPHLAAKKVSWPTWIGALGGLAAGTFFAGAPIGTAIGLLLGGGSGFGVSALINKKHAPTVGATVHGEDPAIPFGCEGTDEDLSVIAGDLGMPSKTHQLRG